MSLFEQPVNHITVALFCGGRGASSLIEALAHHLQITTKVLVNTYDDGLSTGKLRDLIPGMLGPSDVRKTLISLMIDPYPSTQALKYLLEYRLPQNASYELGREIIHSFCSLELLAPVQEIQKNKILLSIHQWSKLHLYSKILDAYFQEHLMKDRTFNFEDCSLGNLFFSGCFLHHKSDFNKTVSAFNELCEPRGEVLNITEGQNLVLVALKEDGTFLGRESEIVSKQNTASIRRLFLLPHTLTRQQKSELSTLSYSQKEHFLEELSVKPKLNPSVEEILKKADIIIYGPGTQHSSLFPSYITCGVASAIASNSKAEKIFISNLYKDEEIQAETANSIVQKFIHYMNENEENHFHTEQLVSRFFFQKNDFENHLTENALHFFSQEFSFPSSQVTVADWERSTGVHYGELIREELTHLINSTIQKNLKSLPYMVSIIVPALNEARTIKNVLQDLHRLNFDSLQIGKEIILVDGGSQDDTFKIVSSLPWVKAFQFKGAGRGLALRKGIEKARGNIIVFFHSDGEYEAQDLHPIVNLIIKGEFQVVFGSRAIKCMNTSQRIKEIYKGNFLGYLMSKYGGYLLSIIGLIRYNRFLTDPLTGIKAFNSKLLESLSLSANGLDLETEIIGKLGRKGIFISELPVTYRPRHRNEGKKTTIKDGLQALYRLLQY